MNPPLLEIERLEVGGPTPLRIPHLSARSRHLALVEDAPCLRGEVFLSLFRRPSLASARKFLVDGVPLAEALASGVIGYAPRLLSEDPSVQVREVLGAGAKLLGLGEREVREALERVGLAARGKDSLARLTLLEHRLLGLAHALVGRPRALVVEPMWRGLTRPELDRVERVAADLLASHRWLVFAGTGAGSEREFIESLGFFSRLSEAGASDPKPLRSPTSFRVVVAGDRELLIAALGEEGVVCERSVRRDMLLVHGAEMSALLRAGERVSIELLEIAPEGPLGASAGLV